MRRMAHTVHDLKRISYPEKRSQRLLLHSGSGLAVMGIMYLGAVLGGNNGAELFPTVSFVSIWASLTGVFGICSACWYPNNHDLLVCDTDIRKCRKALLACYKIYLGAIVTEICATVALIIQATVIADRNLWKEDTRWEYMWILMGIGMLIFSFLLACRMAYSIRDFAKLQQREDGQAFPSSGTLEGHSHPISVDDVVSDSVIHPDPPPYSEQVHGTSALPPAYAVIEAGQPLLCSTLAGANDEPMDELPPSYSQVMDSNAYTPIPSLS